MGSAGRWPAVFNGPPNTASPGFAAHRLETHRFEARSHRRAGDAGTRAACSPHPTASFRLRTQEFRNGAERDLWLPAFLASKFRLLANQDLIAALAYDPMVAIKLWDLNDDCQAGR